MAETDIQQTARFTREFVVMSLVPWMEKCVLEWNENVCSVEMNLFLVNVSISVSFHRLGGCRRVFFLLHEDYSALPHPHHRLRPCRLMD
jgi:hypothetical protein